ncbi:MAG: hypothetical protein JWM16_2719 [Verrucomicrobiales bacterium]|nr:hypothetical protein [Verrucomicrobiales bacterium]
MNPSMQRLRLSLKNFHLKPGAAFPIFCLLLASVIASVLLGIRGVCTGQSRHLSLIWNLFLAWTPLFFAVVLGHWFHHKRTRDWKFFACAFGWLIFFPNAPYIVTDLVHVSRFPGGLYWVDLVVSFLFALIGLAVGFLSLHLVHEMAARVWNRVAGWTFVLAATGLSGLGVYIGRFLRWNSWDIFLNPVNIATDLFTWFYYPKPFLLSALFAGFLLLAYLMFHAITHLNPIHPTGAKDNISSPS